MKKVFLIIGTHSDTYSREDWIVKCFDDIECAKAYLLLLESLAYSIQKRHSEEWVKIHGKNIPVRYYPKNPLDESERCDGYADYFIKEIDCIEKKYFPALKKESLEETSRDCQVGGLCGV